VALMTEAKLRENLEAFAKIEVHGNPAGGWIVTFPWGRKVNIKETHIDLRGITKRLPGEEENDREQLEFELMELAHEVWGDVSLLSLGYREWSLCLSYAKAYGIPVDDGPFRPFSKAHARHHFGEQAKVGRSWLPCGWRISLPDGSAVVIGLNGREEKTIDKVVGSGQIYAAAISLLRDLQGFAIVRGTKENILAGIAQGAPMDVEVIPEVYPSFMTQMKIGMACSPLFFVGLIVGIGSDSVGAGLIGGIALSQIAAWIWCWTISRGGIQGARQRGQALKSAFPSVQGGNRKAGIDDAKTRGML
jgi:hypothetical protein